MMGQHPTERMHAAFERALSVVHPFSLHSSRTHQTIELLNCFTYSSD